MKKTWKKLTALAVAMMMVLAMSVTVYADDPEPTPTPTETPAETPTTYPLSVNTANNKAAHTYEVYQIFTGTVSEGKLTNVKYGASYTPSGKSVGDPVDKATLDAITDARAWIEANRASLGAKVTELNATTTSYDAAPGWYVILDTNYTYDDDRTIEDNDAYSAFIVKVVDKQVAATPKSVAPSVDKEVQDQTADAEEGAEDGWGETADHKIGETFQFRLTATLPADTDYDAYDEYLVTFNDTMSDGVTFESIESVTVDGETVTDYDCTATAGQAGGAWTLTIADVKAVDGVDLTNGADIVVVYNAHLNTNAILHNASAEGTNTNNNKVSLTYSNNPDATGGNETTDTTKEDYVWVFTYKVNGTKIDSNDQPVPGAGFTLSGDDGVVSLYKVDDKYYVYDEEKTDYPAGGEVVTEILTTEQSNTFEIAGLDVGTYTLEETTVPEGFTKCDNVTIEISATHAENASQASADLTLENEDDLNQTIINETSAILPETGGIGTTIFYVLGAILVLGGTVVLVTRRRMAA